MKLAILGVTGLVGDTILKVLEGRKFPLDILIPMASAKSAGRHITYKGKIHEILTPEAGLEFRPDIAIFSAGSGPSLEYAPLFSHAKCTVIDNSSAWRMNPDNKLIVPEVNGVTLTKEDTIIANPNCSTIQMVVALNPLHLQYKIKRLVISTYQSVTGTGKAAVKQLEDEREGIAGDKAYPYPIDLNCLPHIDSFEENGYTKEELKLVNETRKIMNAPDMGITATTVRVPVLGGHSESVNVTFENDYDLVEVKKILSKSPGVELLDDVSQNLYPMPILSAGRDVVLVGRLRRDFSAPKSLNMWIVSDNLRKGAATNAVQIAELVMGLGGDSNNM